jgi:hypothetical protein
MTENAKNLSAQKTIEDPPEYNAEKADNPKEGSDRQEKAGRMGTGNIAPSTSTDGAYQTASHSTGYTDQLGSADWLGGPQNGDEAPGEAEKTLQEKPSSDISGPTGSGKVASSSSESETRHPNEGVEVPDSLKQNAEKGYAVPSVMTENAKNPKKGSDWLGGPQNGEEIPGNGGNGGNAYGSGNAGNGGNG